MKPDMALLTGAYAVNALAPEERDDFERHLADCPECAEEIRELRETAARLGATAAAAPPESLKARVLAEVSTTRQDPPAEAEEPSKNAEVTQLRPRTSWANRLAVAAAVLGIALAGAFGAVALDNQQQLTQAEQQMEQARERGAAMAQIMEAPDAQTITASEGGMSAKTMMSHEVGKAVFMSSEASPPPDGRVYQLWFIGPYGFESAGLLQQNDAGRMSPLVAPVPADTQAMGITVEPANGSPQPTTNPVLTMNMPA